MNNVVVVLCAFVVIPVAQAEDAIADFIDINRKHCDSVLNAYEVKLGAFNGRNKGLVEAIDLQNELFAASISQSSAYLTSLLDNVANECIRKYDDRVPMFEQAQQSISNCNSSVTDEHLTLLNYVAGVSEALGIYIQRVFHIEIPNCGPGSSARNACISYLLSTTKNFVYENQKKFEYRLGVAESRAKDIVQKFADCVYSVNINVLTRLKILIDNCVTASNECPVCLRQSNIEVISVSLNPEDEIIVNPLYGRTDKPKSVSLDLRWGDSLPVLDIDLENELNA